MLVNDDNGTGDPGDDFDIVKIEIELGAAFIVPNVLRWYWWRFNGWGYAIGTFVGLAGALLLLTQSHSCLRPAREM